MAMRSSCKRFSMLKRLLERLAERAPVDDCQPYRRQDARSSHISTQVFRGQRNAQSGNARKLWSRPSGRPPRLFSDRTEAFSSDPSGSTLADGIFLGSSEITRREGDGSWCPKLERNYPE
jgi:hypothetical protein